MTDGDREILDHFTRTRAKTIELLGRLPDDYMSRTANGEEYSVGWLFGHIAQAVDFWMERCMKDGKLGSEIKDQDKTSINHGLEGSRDRLVAFFSAEDGAALGQTYSHVWKRTGKEEQFTGRNRVVYLTQHEAHHRGKIVLALRQWGFTDIPFLPY